MLFELSLSMAGVFKTKLFFSVSIVLANLISNSWSIFTMKKQSGTLILGSLMELVTGR